MRCRRKCDVTPVGFVATVALLVVYAALLRPRLLRWGATAHLAMQTRQFKNLHARLAHAA